MTGMVIIFGIPTVIGCFQISKYTVYFFTALYRAVKAMQLEEENADI